MRPAPLVTSWPGGKLHIHGDRTTIRIRECHGDAARLTFGASHCEGDFAEVPSCELGKLGVVEVVDLALWRNAFCKEDPHQRRSSDNALPAHYLERFIDRVPWQPDVPVVIPVMENRQNRHYFCFSCHRWKRGRNDPYQYEKHLDSQHDDLRLGLVEGKHTPLNESKLSRDQDAAEKQVSSDAPASSTAHARVHPNARRTQFRKVRRKGHRLNAEAQFAVLRTPAKLTAAIWW